MALSNYYHRIKQYVEENTPEVLVGVGTFTGIVLVTLALVMAFSAPWIWFLSAGLTILGCVGIRFLRRLFFHGLYLPWLEEQQESQQSQR